MEDFGGSVPESRQAWGAVRLVECRFTSTETIGLLGTGAQDGHLHFHTAPDLCVLKVLTDNDILFRSFPVLIPLPAHHCGWQVAGISGAID